MNRFFRHPATNAVGISIFSCFYGIVFFGFSDLVKSQTGQSARPFWRSWDIFLSADGHQFAAVALLTLTAVVVALLLFKHKPYDEYHTSILIKCLTISVLLILAAIGVFFVMVLADPAGIMSKFIFFIMGNWTIVVVADLVYLIICGMK